MHKRWKTRTSTVATAGFPNIGCRTDRVPNRSGPNESPRDAGRDVAVRRNELPHESRENAEEREIEIEEMVTYRTLFTGSSMPVLLLVPKPLADGESSGWRIVRPGGNRTGPFA